MWSAAPSSSRPPSARSTSSSWFTRTMYSGDGETSGAGTHQYTNMVAVTRFMKSADFVEEMVRDLTLTKNGGIMLVRVDGNSKWASTFLDILRKVQHRVPELHFIIYSGTNTDAIPASSDVRPYVLVGIPPADIFTLCRIDDDGGLLKKIVLTGNERFKWPDILFAILYELKVPHPGRRRITFSETSNPSSVSHEIGDSTEFAAGSLQSPVLPHSAGVEVSTNQINEDKQMSDNEKNIKATTAFYFFLLDKLPGVFLSLFGMTVSAAAARATLGAVIPFHPSSLEILCVFILLMIFSSIMLFAFAGYFHEKGCTDSRDFFIFSWVVFAQHIALLALLCLTLIAVAKAGLWILLPMGFTAFIFILTWQIPHRQYVGSSIWNFIKRMWSLRRKKIPDEENPAQ